jgi:hypothetical protein
MATQGGLPFDPAALDAADKMFWSEVWDTAVDDAVEDMGIEMWRLGPVLAGVVIEEPADPGLNFILGAGSEGAVEGGYLSRAVEWIEAHDVDYRVPMLPGLPGVAAAEKWFFRHGNARVEGPARFVRRGSHPDFVAPPVEVIERVKTWDDESFGDPLAESLRLPKWAATFFLDLQGRPGWRCYCAIDGDEPLAYLAMVMHERTAELVLASLPTGELEGAGQDAVIYRCLSDAAAAGCETIVVGEAGFEPAVADRESLQRAGFERTFEGSTWQPRTRVTT